MRIAKGKQEIGSIEEWFLYAPPEKGEKQWVNGRSAKEMARIWLTEEMRERLRLFLQPVFGDVVLESAEPECNVPFDEFSGPRQCDLVVQARSREGLILVHVEGKADEPFGAFVRKTYADANAANALRDEKSKSAVPRRIELLTEHLFGRRVDDSVGALRYQLLYSTAAVLSDAVKRGAIAAVSFVHELRSEALDPSKLRENKRDWEKFLKIFPDLHGQKIDDEGVLLGPVSVAWMAWQVPLYFAKAVSTISVAVNDRANAYASG